MMPADAVEYRVLVHRMMPYWAVSSMLVYGLTVVGHEC